MLMMSANESLEKKNFLHDFLLWDFTTKKLVKTLRQQFKLNMETRSFTAQQNVFLKDINPFTTFKPLG